MKTIELTNDPTLVRRNKSYKYYSALRKELVKLNADDEDAAKILLAVHAMVDKNMWYGNEKTSLAAEQSLALLEKECGRECDECKKPMDQGFVIDDGDQYYCSEKCLHKHISPKKYLSLYDDGNGDSYWTEF